MQVTFRVTRDAQEQARRLVNYHLRSKREQFVGYLFIAVLLCLFGATVVGFYVGHPRHWSDFPRISIVLFMVMAAESRRRHHEFASAPDYTEKQTLEVDED